jgi:MFS family permease
MLHSSSMPTRVRWGVLVLLCLLSMITYIDRVCFGVAGPSIVAALGLTDAGDLKGAFTAFAIAYSLFEVPSGWLGDRWGARRTLTRIVLWWSAFTVLTGMVGWSLGGMVLGGAGSLIVIRFLFGAGEAGAYPNIARAIHDWFPPDRWARVQGLIWMSGRLAGGLTPLVWLLLVSGSPSILDWRSVFFLFGMLGVAWSVGFWLLFRDEPSLHPQVNQAELELIRSGRDQARDAASAVVDRFWDVLTQRQLWLLSAVYFLVNYGWYFNITYLPSYLKDRFGAADSDVWMAIYKGGPLWIGAIGCVVGGRCADALGKWMDHPMRARRWLNGSALSGASLFWLGAMFASTATEFFFFTSAAAFCTDLTLGATWATCQETGGRFPAVSTAVMNTIGTLGAATAGWATGVLLEMNRGVPSELPLNWEQVLRMHGGYHSAFLTFSVGYALAALGWMWIGRQAKRGSVSFPRLR